MAKTGVTIEIFIHLDMVGRNGWTAGPEERPLTEVGKRQAEYLARSLTRDRVDAVYASPNVRCRQSVEPLAKAAGLEIQEVQGFQDVLDSRTRAADQGPDVFANAYLAGSSFADIVKISAALPDGGRAVICSNGGEIAPALATFIAGLGGGEMPARPKRAAAGGLERGGVYTLNLSPDSNQVTYSPPPADFPQ